MKKNGGCARIRTLDPLIKSQLLYQLSYTPIKEAHGFPEAGLLGHLRRIVQPEISPVWRSGRKVPPAGPAVGLAGAEGGSDLSGERKAPVSSKRR